MLQTSLDFRPKKWGGARAGAGRKKTGKRRDVEHRARPKLSKHHPQHAVLRVRRDVPRLRRGKIYQALRRTIARMLDRPAFRVVHLSIQHNHLHFLIEADTQRDMQLGMQALAISAAKAINKASGRTGKVFEFRYHATPITSPRQTRHALSYVLNNWRRHSEDERTQAARFAAVDPYSSAMRFDGWKQAREAVLPPGFDPEVFEPMPVSRPATWLLTTGWKRHYPPINVHEVPGPLH